MGYEDSEALFCMSIQESKWEEYDRLRNLVDKLGCSRFFDVASRNVIRERFCNLRGVDIVNTGKRFPDGLYVNLGNAVMSDLILSVIRALDVSDRSSISELIELKVAFDLAVKNINLAMNSANYSTMAINGIFTRWSFEKHFSLIWFDNEFE